MNATIQQTTYHLIYRTMDQYYDALFELGSGNVEPMKALWLRTDEVSYKSPTGQTRQGWNEVVEDWSAQAGSTFNSQLEPQEYHVMLDRNIAIVLNEAKGAQVDENGNKQAVSLQAIHTLRKEKGQWKIIGAHTA